MCVTRELDDHHSAVNVASPFYISFQLRNPLHKLIFIKNTFLIFTKRHILGIGIILAKKYKVDFFLRKNIESFLAEEKKL